MKKPYISIVCPVYQCDECLPTLCTRTISSTAPITDNIEIILINDAGTETSWSTIQQLSQKDPRIKGIDLSRNFGQHCAIACGLDHSLGEWIVVMDCDLQDRPEEITRFYQKTNEGYDIVLGRRVGRKDGLLKRCYSRLFYGILGYLTGTRQDHTVANFGIYNRKVIKAICSMNDYIRYFPTMAQWVGFRTAHIDVNHDERKSGGSAYSLQTSIDLALDIILSFSDKPLILTIKLGICVALTSLAAAFYHLLLYAQGKIIVLGWASLILSVWFLSGLIIFLLGVIGLYVGKTFEKVKQRPLYIISDTANIDD